jgi:hypothetical protein
MVLDAAGIAAGWQTETMPDVRMMVDTIVMPDGNVLLINGAKTGVSTFSMFDTRGSFIKCRDVIGGWLWQRLQSDWPIEC